MPILETTIATVVLAAASVKLVVSGFKSIETRQRRRFEEARRSAHAAFTTLGAAHTGESSELIEHDAAYVFPAREDVLHANGAFTITRVDGSETFIMLRVVHPHHASKLSRHFTLGRTSTTTTSVASSDARAYLPEDVTVSGETFELTRALLPASHEKLSWLDEVPNARVDRFEISDQAVTLAVTITADKRQPTGATWDVSARTFHTNAEDALARMWTICSEVSFDRPVLSALKDAVQGSKPGGTLRASALRRMIERAPRAPSTLRAWKAVVERGHHIDLLVCHSVAPARLERDLSYDTVATLLRTLSDRPHEEQESFATLIVRRLGHDAFVSTGTSPATLLLLFERAFSEDLLEADDLHSVFSTVVGVTSLAGDLDRVADMVARLGWAGGARTVCLAKAELGARISDDPFLSMLEEITRVDAPGAREFEIESALLGLITPRPKLSVEDTSRALELLVILGGWRTIDALRAYHTSIPMPRDDEGRVLQLARDIEDRLGGIISRGGLSVSGDDELAGGLSQASGEAGGLEVSERVEQED